MDSLAAQSAAQTGLTEAANMRASGDEVLVYGSIRVVRPTGGFSESQISWTYRFRDGRLAAVGWSPRQAG